ncbi:TPA: hypothetical protein ACP5VK_004376, partial [Vibrio parahaemolyticus]
LVTVNFMSEVFMSENKRLQMDVSIKTFESLKKLKESTGASSYGDVTARAYKLYEYVCKQVEEDNEIIIRKKDGTEFKVEFL